MASLIQIKQWLNNRGITDTVIAANKLDWNGMQIVIPIFDLNGNFLFNKYRRNPFGPEDVPKYTYEKGATAQLYGAHKIKDSTGVIITEGETDSLRLESEGYIATTSTGGAGTFKDEWIPLFAGKEVAVCFDNDEAGIKGAIKLLTKLPAKLVLIPRREGIKDITNYLQKGGSFAGLLTKAESYPILSEPIPEFKFIKDVEAQIKKYNYFLEHLLVQERNAKNAGQAFWHYDYIRQLLLNAIDNLRHEIRKMRYFKKPIQDGNGKITPSDIEQAKAVPLDTFLKVNRSGFARCPFHQDDTPSLKVYKDTNRWYCYSCSSGNDMPDLYMKLNNCDFITAVKKLVNK